jgi:hypothetical protein
MPQAVRGGLMKRILRSFVCFQAERAEGFINLTDFIIDRAIECKKKQ